jgi:hypothetical protein
MRSSGLVRMRRFIARRLAPSSDRRHVSGRRALGQGIDAGGPELGEGPALKVIGAPAGGDEVVVVVVGIGGVFVTGGRRGMLARSGGGRRLAEQRGDSGALIDAAAAPAAAAGLGGEGLVGVSGADGGPAQGWRGWARRDSEHRVAVRINEAELAGLASDDLSSAFMNI